MDEMSVSYDNMSLAERIEVDAPRIGLQGNAEQKLRKAIYESNKISSAAIQEKYTTKELIASYRNKRGKLISMQIDPLRKIFSTLGIEKSSKQGHGSENIELINVQEINFPNLKRGLFWAFTWSLLGGAGILAWWYKFVSTGLDMPLQQPTLENLSKMLEWSSAFVGLTPSSEMGALIVSGLVLAVMVLVFIIVKTFRSFSNLRKAKKVEKDTLTYLEEKEKEVKEVSKIKKHVENLDSTIARLNILLAELKAKIERAIHLENTHEYAGLHDNSKADVKNAEFILDTADSLLAVPATIDGVVNNKSIDMLKSTERAIGEYIDKLYKSPKQKPFMSDNLSIDHQECEELK